MNNWPPDIFDVVFVPLTRGKFATIDRADWPLVSTCKWSAKKHGRTFYARTGSLWSNGKQRFAYMHRLILGSGPEVDHEDGNGTNNRRSNLRPCTRGQNLANRPPAGAAGTAFKGVTYLADRRKWKAQITVEGRRKNLGYFATDAEAAAAYDRAAVEVFGTFARLNFPGGPPAPTPVPPAPAAG